MKLSPFPDDNVYFVAGGISSRGHWEEDERFDFELPQRKSEPEPEPKEPPPPWTCQYCGTLNPPDTWSCSHCPAPRTEVTKSEQAIWRPPVRVESHEEEEPIMTGIPSLDWIISSPGMGQIQPSKPPAPAWAAFLQVGLFLIAWMSFASCVGSLFVGAFPPALVLASISGLCYYILKYTSRAFKRRYDWGDK